MELRVGTSGWSYKEWKGSFYPEKIKNAEMLAYYAERLGTVEVNNTFYRMPKAEVVEGWAAQVPESFRFVLKASRRITHNAKLGADAVEPLEYLLKVSEALGVKRGPILFQTAPWFKRNDEVLAGFLKQIPDGVQAAFEFRSTSWWDETVFDLLRDANASLVLADTGSEDDPPPVATADWGYARLRKVEYDEGELESWAARLREFGWGDAYIFFKHEDEGTGPKLARRFEEIVAGG